MPTQADLAPTGAADDAPELSVVVPVYNESANVAPLVARLVPTLERCVSSFQIVFVDDGSSDDTLSRVAALAAQDPRIEAVSFSRNFGKEIAIAAGLDHSRGQAAVIMDADLQHPPEVVARFVECWRAGYKNVFGQRRARDTDARLRRVLSQRFYRLFDRFGETALPQGAGDFRLLDRQAIDALGTMRERARFTKGLYAWIGFRGIGVPFDVDERASGSSKFSYRKLTRFALDGIMSFSTMPLKVWTFVGVTVSVVALSTAVYFLVDTLVRGVDVPGYASLIVSVMFFAGIQLLSLGVLGEYIGRIFAEVKNRPLYIVAERIGPSPGDRPPSSAMIRSVLSVGGFTLLSRVTGLVRDIVLGAVLGAGFAADAFVVAFRLPNHFRAIFGEGAFNAAYVPAYARTLERDGHAAAHVFADRIFTLLLASQVVLLALAVIFTPQLVDALAPGFRDEPQKFDLAVALTRITFPYLLCITLVTLQTGTLNATGRFAAGAFAPVLLNVCMIAALALAFLFPSAAYASAAGVLAAGVAQLALVSTASWRAGLLERPAMPKLDAPVRRFFAALGPAVIGSAGVQIALFADTIIGSLLPTGGVSSIYYADRLYQLPIGVIGIAAGTVLLPQMSRAFAAGDPATAFRAQNRTLALSVALAAPCLAAFVAIPDLLVRAAFLRGRFTAADAQAAAAVLAAYGIGLMPVVLIASARASFQARGDTTTPMVVALAGVAVNVALKVVLFRPLGAPGLALATAAGAWINIAGLFALAWRGRSFQPDGVLGKIAGAAVAASVAMGLVLWFGRALAMRGAAGTGVAADVVAVCSLGIAGLAAYALVFLPSVQVLGVDLARLRPPRRRRKETS